MIECPACGKENEDAAWECKRCRAPLREGEPPEGSLGTVCRRCEAYNEPGVRVCTACGLELFLPPPPPTPAAATGAPAMTMTSELRALSLSDEEAAEAGLGVLPSTTPPPAPVGRRPPPSLSTPPSPAAAEKPCASCGAANPPAAKFCFECGTAFGKKPERASAPPTIQVDPGAADDDATILQSAPLDAGQAEGAEGWPPPQEPVPAESVAERLPDDAPQEQEWLPFQANLVVEKGNAPGTTFPLAHRENPIGSDGAAISLREDAYVGPLSATLVFVEERLLLRDEGAANGVFVKLRAPTPLEPGDHFIAGERLFRFEGPVALPPAADGPVLGTPRPAGTALRVVEVLAGGRTGRTCHRGAPSLTIGRTGCDMNFPGDALLAAKHAEIRIAEDGSATLADLGQGPSGVLLRVRRQTEHEVHGGDLIQVGEQQLRIEIAS